MIAPLGLVELTLSASVTPAIETVRGWSSVGVSFDIVASRRLMVQPAQDDRLIGELQPLDMQHPISPVGPDIVGHDQRLV